MKRVVIVGGAGEFGARLAQGLSETSDSRIVIAGRSRARAEAVATRIGAEAAVLDRQSARADDVRALAADIVIDAAGPFQNSDLSFVRVVIEAGADYIDLSDARDFAARFGELDALAKRANVICITGASSTPALTHAAIEAMCAGWRRIDAIHAGIAPSDRAPRGASLVAAILTWTGKPLRVFVDGAWTTRRGWSHCGTWRLDGLGRRRFALAETPDLDLLVTRYAPRDAAMFMAALEQPLLHRGLELLSAMGARLEPMAGALKMAADALPRMGADRGGMFVEVLGRDGADRPRRVRWTLIADGVGPFVPTLPALTLTRKLLRGARGDAGARACVGVLTLDDLAADFARLGIRTRVEEEALVAPFERALGAAFEDAPAAVVRAHRGGPVTRLEGRARVAGAASPLAELAARCVGFPRKAKDAPARVTMRLGADGVETWEREIGGRRFRSTLRYVAPGVVSETFGPFTFQMALEADADALRMRVIGWRLGPLPLPNFLAPRSAASERMDAEGRFQFDVPIAAPLLGRLTHYTGHLTPDEA